MIVDINESNFQEFTHDNSHIILAFHAPWAIPCRKMRVRIRRLCKEYDGMSFGIVNADINVPICDSYNVVLLPTLVYLHNNTKVGRLESLHDCKEIKSWIENIHANVVNKE